MTRGAWIVPLLVVSALVFGGATAHAASTSCTTAKAKVAAATKAVTRAKRTLRNAKTPLAKARARRALRKAKRRRASAIAGQKKACATPAAPRLGSTSPASPSNSNNLAVKGTAAPGTTVKLYRSANCDGTPVATGSASQFGSAGLAVTVPDNSTTTFRGTATNAGGTSSCSSSSVSYVEDSLAPAPPTLTGTTPPSPAEDTAPEIKGTAEPGSTVKLHSDPNCAGAPVATGAAGVFAAGGLTVNVPPNSTSVFRATATDTAGNTSPCSQDSVEYVHRPPNQPPVFPAQTIKSTVTNQYTVVLGQLRLSAHTVTLMLTPGATDPDGDPITYTWEASNGTITGNGLSATWVRVVENYAIVPGTATLTASDGRGGIAKYVFQ